jgi:hypothetical protein
MTKQIEMDIQGSEGGKSPADPPSLGTPIVPNDQTDRDGNSRESKGEQRGRIERNITVSKQNKPNTLKTERKRSITTLAPSGR